VPPETPAGAIHDGKPVTTIGDRLKMGHMPPWFELDRERAKGEPLKRITIQDLGPRFILLSVPSLDTPVCDEEAKRFGELSQEVPDYKILIASMDLPFAQRRWLEEHNSPLEAGSDHRAGSFGQAYGVLMKEPRLLMRAVFVARDGYLKHCEYIHDSAKQVDFDAAIAAAKK